MSKQIKTISQKIFVEAFDKLQRLPRRKEVLMQLLNGQSDEEIAKSLGIEQGTVRKHISEICNNFKLKESPGSPKRIKLFTIFATYMPELIGDRSRPSSTPKSLAEGQVNIASDFYIERPDLEKKCCEAILEPGSVLRLKAPQQMGKTMLLNKVLGQVKQEGYRTLSLDFGLLADSTVLSDYNKFLKSFCFSVGQKLELENKLADYWEELTSGNQNTTFYFQKYLLAEITNPLVLALENFDLIFEHEIFWDFCKLLRGWHGESREGDDDSKNWQKLRLVVAYTTDYYCYSDINITTSSPFRNLGVVVKLPEFCPEQVQELAQCYGLTWEDAQVKQLMNLLGGHPWLVQAALRYIRNYNVALSQFLKTAPTEAGIYSNHLRQHLANLKKQPQLAEAFSEVVKSQKPVPLESEQTFKLDSMGLVRLEDNRAMPRCNLYRQYFQAHLNELKSNQ